MILSYLSFKNEAIVSKLDKIKMTFETRLRENMDRKTSELSEKKLELTKKREQIKGLVKFLEKKSQYHVRLHFDRQPQRLVQSHF